MIAQARRRRTRGASLVGLALLLGGAFGVSPEAWAKPPAAGDWETEWKLEAEQEFDSNVFRLSPAQKDKLDLDAAGDQVSGRFADMKTKSDVSLSPSAAFQVRSERGLGGRRLTLGTGIDHHQYLRNPKLSYAKLGISLEQELSGRSEVRLRTEYVPSRFRKNYLAEATDAAGSVALDERVYRAGTYREWDHSIRYRHRFLKRKDERIGVSGSALAGYASRRYEAPFGGRDRRALRTEFEADLDLHSRWRADFGYGFESAHGSATPEVQILDERDFALDFNNDGDATDSNLRVVQRVDRSLRDHTLALGSTVELTKSLDASFRYERLMRSYTSKEAVDPAHKDRDDTRDTVVLGLSYRIRKDLRITAAYEHSAQKTDRQGDPGSVGEETDYKIDALRGGLTYRF